MEFCTLLIFTKIKNIFKIKACSSGDRASDSDSESQGFDSLHVYLNTIETISQPFFDTKTLVLQPTVIQYAYYKI